MPATTVDKGSPIAPVPPDDPRFTSSNTNIVTRQRRSNPTVASLLHEEENSADMNFPAVRRLNSSSTNDDPCGDFDNMDVQRATTADLLCRKSKALTFGQILSLLLAATGAVQSSLYLNCGLSAPTFSMFSFYLPLCIICTVRLLRQSNHGDELQLNTNNREESFHQDDGVVSVRYNEESGARILRKISKPFSLCRIVPLQSPPWKYAGVAIADVYANYTTILAFKYTTITSVSLFDALAIPSAMLVSRLFFCRKYTKVHLLAVAVCCIGISINVIHDYIEDKRLKETGGVGETAAEELVEEEYPYKLAGDLFAICGGILFGISNTLAEVAVRDWGSQDEFISAMSFFASIITFFQTLVTEREEVKAFFSTRTDSCPELGSLTLLAVFVLATMFNYLGIASFLGMSDAAFLNLSLLTGDAWAVAFSVFAEGIYPPPTFYVALIITVSGVFIYEAAPSPVGENSHRLSKANEESEIEMSSNNTESPVLT